LRPSIARVSSPGIAEYVVYLTHERRWRRATLAVPHAYPCHALGRDQAMPFGYDGAAHASAVLAIDEMRSA
jgi:hypothetical protein